MVTVKGRTEFGQYRAKLPKTIETLLRGAGRAGATVIAEEARQRSISREVSGAIKVRVSAKAGLVTAKIQVNGDGAYIAPWLEYGTAPHVISVDESQREGRSIKRINRQAKDAGGHSLVISGQFVGATILHPGARPHPFLRPALDVKHDEAVSAAQGYINSRVRASGIVGDMEPAP